jgi:hypothetical protein
MQILEAEPWSSVRTIAEFLKIPVSMVHLHLTTSLNMKSRHFKWVLHFLDDGLTAKQFECAWHLFDVLQAQEKCHFRDLITGEETLVYLDMKPGTNWLPADAELLAFWGIHGIAHYCWLAKQSTLDSPFFCEEVLSPLAQKIQPNSKTSQTPDFDSYGQCKGSHSKGNPREIGCFPIQMHATATVTHGH